MAVIGRIRKRVGLLIGFVGASMVLFILGDLVTSNKGIMGRNSDVIAVIGGEKVRYQEFEKKVDQMTEAYKNNSGKENVEQSMTDVLREQAWTQTVNDFTLGKEYKKLGVACSPEELYDMIAGKNIHPQVRQVFTDKKTGQFNPQDIVKFLKDLPNRDEKTQLQWRTFEDALHEDRIAEKYRSIIKSGIYVTTAEAKNNFEENTRMASIKYVKLDYSTIPDASVKIEESDLKSYYNDHKNDYKQDATVRKFEYVTYDVKPSDEDRTAANEWIAKKKEEFASAALNDSLFVNQNSDVPFDSTYKEKGQLSPMIDSVIFDAAIGTIIGPYEERGSLKLSKLIEKRDFPDSVKVSHCLVAYNGAERANPAITRTHDDAKLRADSILTYAQKGEKEFIEVAKGASDDMASAQKDGDLGWINKDSQMDEKFKAGSFMTGKGEVRVVESPFGFHIIRIFDVSKSKKEKVQVATVERKVEASQKTFDKVYQQAQAFAANNRTAAEFDAAVVKQGLNKRVADNIKESDKNVAGLEQPREMIRWAYKATKGEVSKVFTLGDKYVIAKLVDIKEEGTLPMEEVMDVVKAGAFKEKKAKMLMEQITSKAQGATTIDAVAAKLNQPAVPAENINFANNYIQGIGSEPRLLGAIFSSKPGQLSKPVKGENAVFVFVIEKINEAPASKDYTASQTQLMNSRGSRSDGEVFSALKVKAKIVDDRGKFY